MDELLDPEIHELGFVVDRDALRARLEQEIGFADFGKYARETPAPPVASRPR
jgi:hypothetical protein